MPFEPGDDLSDGPDLDNPPDYEQVPEEAYLADVESGRFVDDPNHAEQSNKHTVALPGEPDTFVRKPCAVPPVDPGRLPDDKPWTSEMLVAAAKANGLTPGKAQQKTKPANIAPCRPEVLQPAENTAPPIRFRAAGDLEVKPIAWLVDGYVEEDALVVMFGPPGEGKSFIALDLSCCIATGHNFHGRPVQQGAVFYIAGEGHNGIARRLESWAKHHGVSLSDAALFISEGATDLASATNAVRVAEAVQSLADSTGKHPTLIVIDTLARNFGGDENSATDVGSFVRHVDTHLRHKWNATTLIVHHSGKDGGRGARGSSALKCAADAEYEVGRNAEDKIIRLTPRKMKDAEEPAPLAFELVGISIADTSGQSVGGAALSAVDYEAPTVSATAGMGKNQQQALAVLRQMHGEISERLASQGREGHPVYVTTNDWRQRCEAGGMQSNRVSEARDGLIKRGLISLDGPHVILNTKPSETPELHR